MPISRYIVVAVVRCSWAFAPLAGAPVEPAETEVAVGDEGAHAELGGQGQWRHGSALRPLPRREAQCARRSRRGGGGPTPRARAPRARGRTVRARSAEARASSTCPASRCASPACTRLTAWRYPIPRESWPARPCCSQEMPSSTRPNPAYACPSDAMAFGPNIVDVLAAESDRAFEQTDGLAQVSPDAVEIREPQTRLDEAERMIRALPRSGWRRVRGPRPRRTRPRSARVRAKKARDRTAGNCQRPNRSRVRSPCRSCISLRQVSSVPR